jgi:Na+/melibiose symporter-like transporter
MADTRQGKTPFSVLLAYIAPCLPMAALGLPLVVYLPAFYANQVGISLSVVGGAFMLVRTVDIVFDPFIGGVMDRTRSRFGQFRLWIMIGAPIVFAGAAMAYFPPKGVGALYLYAALIITYGGYSIVALAHSAWGARLSADYHERSRIYGAWQTANIVGLLLVLAAPILAHMAGYRAPGDSVRAMGVLTLVTLPIAILMIVRFTPEPLPVVAGKGETSHDRSLSETFAALVAILKRQTIVRILTADLLLGLAPGVTGALFLFFFRSKGYSTNESNILLLCYFIGGIVGTPIWMRLSRVRGKHTALIIASLYYAGVQALAMLAPKLPLMQSIPILVMTGLSYSASLFFLKSLMADATDDVRLHTGRDETGLLFALLGSTNKLGYAIAVGATFIGLDFVKFNPAEGATNSAAAMQGLAMIYIVPPSVLAVLGALVLVGYPLTAKRHAEIRSELDQRAAS